MAWNKILAALYLKHRIREDIGEQPKHGLIAEYAAKVHVLPQTISQIRSQRGGVHVETFDAFATYWQTTHDKLMADAREWAAGKPAVLAAVAAEDEAGRETVHRGPVRAALPEWLAAEAQARITYARRAVPDRAWLGARELAGFRTPPVIDAEVVYRTALAWLEIYDAPEKTADEEKKDRDDERRIEKLQDEVKSSRRKPGKS